LSFVPRGTKELVIVGPSYWDRNGPKGLACERTSVVDAANDGSRALAGETHACFGVDVQPMAGTPGREIINV
jgi:hypothetical protein